MSVRRQTGPRTLLRQLRELMAAPGEAQHRLNQVVQVVAANMVAEVCSVYLIRDGLLELFATEGLNAEAVHNTKMRLDEGLVGLIAREARPISLADAQSHSRFSYRPETGEEIYSSLMGVPVVRAGRVVGVLVVQNRTRRQYTEDETEAMQTIAMVLAEMVEALLAETAGGGTANLVPARLEGSALAEGLASGIAVLHRPRLVVERHVADDVAVEYDRLDTAVAELRREVDRMLQSSGGASTGESREILEAYRMFAYDRGWFNRMQAGITSGLTAEAAVERVQIETRARMTEIHDPYLRERLLDIEDLANRLLRILLGATDAPGARELPPDAVVVARHLGPAELLDYDQTGLKALVLEEGAPTSHVAIVARALQIPVVGRVDGLLEQVEPGDPVVVDGDRGLVLLRPTADVAEAMGAAILLREARVAEYAALKDEPAVTLDGTRIELNINAGLLADLVQLDKTGADGVGLYRTELHFMVRSTLPHVATQTEFYSQVVNDAGDHPVMFRTVDIGGDKVLPYMRGYEEENPAMGWRAIRLALDRPALLRMQFRALLNATAGRTLNLMFPMIAEVAEFDAARELLDRDIARQRRAGLPMPSEINVGTMLEVPSLVWQLPALLRRVDFISIGSNDLLQFLFASDRGNSRLEGRYEILSPAALSLLRQVVSGCDAAGVKVSLCGEAAGRPLEAMALLGLGLRSISMSAGSIGPVKQMLRGLDLPTLNAFMSPLLDGDMSNLREPLTQFAQDHGIAI
ncbi:MAG: phosphoenolpyruvate--protein phosphotransferase [Alphaproteobacteria bacterium]